MLGWLRIFITLTSLKSCGDKHRMFPHRLVRTHGDKVVPTGNTTPITHRVDTQATSKAIESVSDWLAQQRHPNTYANAKSLSLYLLQAGRVQLSFVDDLDGDLRRKTRHTNHVKPQIRCLCFVAAPIRPESGGATEAERTPGGEVLMTRQHFEQRW